ncbi:MAG TPA: hypothetical protein DCQ06_09510 [Myxococcales bacterium]|nr:hypothetical protein [Myxococcales bacterium]HAN31820.1 hypothetical protein [Myxococcales bacterium]
MVQARGLGRQFRDGASEKWALQGLELQILGGEKLAVTGPSGAGKSTLLRLLGALDRSYAGELRVNGCELRDLDDRALARFRGQTVGFVFQSFNLLPSYSVGDNLLMPNVLTGALPAADALERARELLDRVGLRACWDQRPLTLSGGQRQRVAVARALLLKPSLVLCDEPTGALDHDTAQQVLDLLDELHAEQACTLIYVTHDERVVARCDRRLQLFDGRMAERQPGGSS